MSVLPIALVVLCLFIDDISGHGRLLVPPNRSSLWRTNDAAPKNYNDDQVNCGGKGVQFSENGGKCGVCGDPSNQAHPQDNENTGKFGRGIIAATYKSGQVIDVQVELTANHMGTFTYGLCILNNPNAPESGESCFTQLKLEDGSPYYTLPNKEEDHSTVEWYNRVKLPDGVKCDRCTFRWFYRVANGWGVCADGSGAVGCGDQETFVECADIRIE